MGRQGVNSHEEITGAELYKKKSLVTLIRAFHEIHAISFPYGFHDTFRFEKKCDSMERIFNMKEVFNFPESVMI